MQSSQPQEAFEFGGQDASMSQEPSQAIDTFQSELAASASPQQMAVASQDVSEPMPPAEPTEVPEDPAPLAVQATQPPQPPPQVQPPTQQHPAVAQPPTGYPTPDDSFFSTVAGYSSGNAASAAQQSRVQRPFQEIVSSVQGNFNFLQESELEAVESRLAGTERVRDSDLSLQPIMSEMLQQKKAQQIFLSAF